MRATTTTVIGSGATANALHTSRLSSVPLPLLSLSLTLYPSTSTSVSLSLLETHRFCSAAATRSSGHISGEIHEQQSFALLIAARSSASSSLTPPACRRRRRLTKTTTCFRSQVQLKSSLILHREGERWRGNKANISSAFAEVDCCCRHELASVLWRLIAATTSPPCWRRRGPT